MREAGRAHYSNTIPTLSVWTVLSIVPAAAACTKTGRRHGERNKHLGERRTDKRTSGLGRTTGKGRERQGEPGVYNVGAGDDRDSEEKRKDIHRWIRQVTEKGERKGPVHRGTGDVQKVGAGTPPDDEGCRASGPHIKAQPPLPDPSPPTPAASPRRRWHRSRTTTTRQAEAGAALPKAEHARPQRLTGDTGCRKGERKRGREEEGKPVRGGTSLGNKRVGVSHHAREKVAMPRAVLRRRQEGHTYPTHRDRGHGRTDRRCQQQRQEKKKTKKNGTPQSPRR